MYNLEPDKRGASKTARNNFLYLFLMLATLGFFLIPVAVVIAVYVHNMLYSIIIGPLSLLL